MDAALSGRLAAKAIGLSQSSGKPVIDIYSQLMKNLVNQIQRNQQRGILSFKTNEQLLAYFDRNMLRMGLNMYVQSLCNRFRSGEEQIMLP